jgi:hypothetical protein
MAKKDKKPKPASPEARAFVGEMIASMTEEERAGRRTNALDNARRIRAEIEANEDMSIAGAMDEFVAVAAKACNMTPAQLKAEAARVDYPHMPETRRTPYEVAKARGIPSLHIKGVVSREPFDCDALREVKAFLAADQQTFLVLAGSVGLRKSGSACWALMQTEGRYVSAPHLFKLAIEREYRDEFVRVCNAPLLVIDELSTEFTDDKGVFYGIHQRLIQDRYVGMLKTIETYNGPAANYRELYGERVASRINESGVFVELGGKDVRGTKEHWLERHEARGDK